MRISVETARKLSLWKQGFHSWPNPEKARLLEAIKRLSCVQIDTINVVERSHYLTLWSRLGPYEKESLDQLLYPDRRIFEFWAHAASIIPIEQYRYFIHAMKQYRKGLKARAERRLKAKAHLLDEVLNQIRRNGPMSSRAFEHEGTRSTKRAGWWNWKPAKMALEMLFSAGVLMVAYRENFQRYYDLTENVLPSHVDTAEPTEEERRRFFVQKALGAWGVAKPSDISSYYYQWSTGVSLRKEPLEKTFRQLSDDDVLGEVEIDAINGQYYMLTNDYETAEGMAEGKTAGLDGVTFLSPFDNLTWSKERNETFFGFVTKLEAYLPQAKRKFGYYNMNILYKDRLVGRLDPKVHRDEGLLEVKLLHFEDDFKPDTEFEEKLGAAFRSFMEFHGAKKIKFGKIVPDTMVTDDFPC